MCDREKKPVVNPKLTIKLVIGQGHFQIEEHKLQAEDEEPPALPPRPPAKSARVVPNSQASSVGAPPLAASAFGRAEPALSRASSQLSQVSTGSGSVAFEGIYDIVPTPRSCLSRRYTHIQFHM